MRLHILFFMISKVVLSVLDRSGIIPYQSNSGIFFYWAGPRTVSLFATCRETFQWYAVGGKEDGNVGPDAATAQNCEMIGFTSGPDYPFKIEHVHRLWMKLEKKLGIRPYSTFYRIARSDGNGNFIAHHGFVIKVNKWWLENTMRRNVMTLFIRGFSLYSQKDFKKPTLMGFLKHYHLAAEASTALALFVDGYTVPAFIDKWMWNASRSERGFVAKFRSLNKDQCLKLLKKPCSQSSTRKTGRPSAKAETTESDSPSVPAVETS